MYQADNVPDLLRVKRVPFVYRNLDRIVVGDGAGIVTRY